MDQTSLLGQNHIVTIRPGSVSSQNLVIDRNDSLYTRSRVRQGSISSTDNLQGPLLGEARVASASSPSHIGQVWSNSGHRQRSISVSSVLWISMQFTITLSQIVASIIVLSMSRDEKPPAQLSIWVTGYAAGCLATLPWLYWRYIRQSDRQYVFDSAHSPTPHMSNFSSHPATYAALSSASLSRNEVYVATSRLDQLGDGASSRDNPRARRLVQRFKIVLDCFFAVWFVVGNVWIFGGHSSSSEASNLYRLCIVFLTFSSIGYAMPFILCAMICCCLPCIISLVGVSGEQIQERGASPEAIAALPSYKFKAKLENEVIVEKDDVDSDGEVLGEGGLVGVGTENERTVSEEDAVCCICLGNYRDGVEIRELPCTHHFHLHCVDKWLKISGSCPLCKHGIAGSSKQKSIAHMVTSSSQDELSHW